MSLFDRDEDGNLSFSPKKKDCLFQFVKEKKLSTLLLSSEFFFKQTEILKTHFPGAIFIAYLRFPLEVIESSYNQGVKRHGETRKLGVPIKPKSIQLNLLESIIKTVGKENFILRPFENECFVGNSLINDFKDVLNLPLESFPKDIDSKKVNTSYSLDALEFKRWFNQFPLGNLQAALDNFLQAYSINKPSFSLIRPNIFVQYKSDYINLMERFCSEYNVHNSQHFLRCCRQISQRNIVRQNISNQEFELLLQQFLKFDSKIPSLLYTQISNEWNLYANIKEPERLKIIKQHISPVIKCSTIVRKFLFKWLK
ncbi:hypothetical protein [Glaciecola sp. 1036]|uniref:hypothetical protein n=1 Tax=Alteromonadaceae TaxID=72275 RepID=UPI003D0340DC